MSLLLTTVGVAESVGSASSEPGEPWLGRRRDELIRHYSRVTEPQSERDRWMFDGVPYEVVRASDVLTRDGYGFECGTSAHPGEGWFWKPSGTTQPGCSRSRR
jgi:hypothetical protein